MSMDDFRKIQAEEKKRKNGGRMDEETWRRLKTTPSVLDGRGLYHLADAVRDAIDHIMTLEGR